MGPERSYPKKQDSPVSPALDRDVDSSLSRDLAGRSKEELTPVHRLFRHLEPSSRDQLRFLGPSGAAPERYHPGHGNIAVADDDLLAVFTCWI